MAFADQANACVNTSTTPLDPHERLGPAGATPGVGNLLLGRPGTRYACLVEGRRRAHAAECEPEGRGAGRQARKSRLYMSYTCHLAGTVKDLCRRGGLVGRHPVRYRRLLYRLVALL